MKLETVFNYIVCIGSVLVFIFYRKMGLCITIYSSMLFISSISNIFIDLYRAKKKVVKNFDEKELKNMKRAFIFNYTMFIASIGAIFILTLTNKLDICGKAFFYTMAIIFLTPIFRLHREKKEYKNSLN